MDEYFAYFLKKFAPQSDQVMPSSAQIDAYRGVLPDALLAFWAKTGWGAHADGLLWLVNPADYEAIAREWIDGLSLPVKEAFHVIARGAFGRLMLWGKTSGKSVMINPAYLQVLTTPPNRFLAEGRDDFAIATTLGGLPPEMFDLDDVKDKPLFKRALKKLGKLRADEMYGFEPALVLGGSPELSKLTKVKLVEHLAILRQLGSVDVIHIDVSHRL